MTPNETSPDQAVEAVAVTQADRDAAAPFVPPPADHTDLIAELLGQAKSQRDHGQTNSARLLTKAADTLQAYASPRELPTSYAHWQQMRGMLADKVDWALNTYDDFNADDAYSAQWILDRIVDGLRETRTALELG